ncbi:MAG: hypothetical protein PSX37_10100, partial [bacterium]|nr:hypothetical protein [bacterium]
VAGHAARYGGSRPDSTAILVMLPQFAVLSIALADRRRSTAALLAYLISTQVFAHVLLVVGFGHSGHAGGSAPLVPGPRMVLGHAIALIFVLLILIYGEDALHRWLRFLADLGRTWNLAFLPILEGQMRSWSASPEPALAWEFSASVQRRGPPTA